MHTIIHGDCLEELKKLDDNSVDAVVTDPPYGLSNTKPKQVADVLAAWVTGETEAVPAKRGGFMGKDWDSFVPPPAVWKECLRVLKPGGHMAVFAGARTQDLMGLSIRLAGFEIRDGLSWITGTGFPKGQDIGKQIDKMKGAKREVVGKNPNHRAISGVGYEGIYQGGNTGAEDVTAPATDEARKWDGWNTQLKPAQEPIILARKPLDGTVANNVLTHGVGGLNIDACRVPTDEDRSRTPGRPEAEGWGLHLRADPSVSHDAGRFPANVLLDEHAAKEMDKQSGVLKSGGGNKGGRAPTSWFTSNSPDVDYVCNPDSGGASRFFPVFKYQAKAPKRERPVIVREDGSKIQHPTVKPLALLDWLVTLITPPGGLVLDPFAGTGTTLQAARNKGYRAIGIEADTDYIQLIHQRMEGGTPSTRNS